MTAPCAPGLPTSITCDFLLGYPELTRSLGGDPGEFLPRAGLTPDVADKADGRISLEALSEVLEITADALQCPDFGMRLAALQSSRPFRPLDSLISNAPNIMEVLSCACDHSEAYVSGLRTMLEHDGSRESLFFRIELPEELAGKAQLIEQLALLNHNGIIRLSGGRARAREVWFLHAPKAPAGAYARQFRTSVRFRLDLPGLSFREADLRAPVVGCDQTAFQAEREIFAARFPAQAPPIEVRVRQAVERAFVEGACTRERVAQLVDVHERTLHRRLAARGASFQEIREQVRRRLALRYLAQTDLSLTDVTGRLGYSELPVLSRSCQRWFQAPPAELRRRLASGA